MGTDGGAPASVVPRSRLLSWILLPLGCTDRLPTNAHPASRRQYDRVNGKIRHDAAREPTRCRTAGVSRGARAPHRRFIAGKTRDAAERSERACPSTMLGAMRHVTGEQFREE